MNDRMTERCQSLQLHWSQSLYKNQIQNQISDSVNDTKNSLTLSEGHDTEKEDFISDHTVIKHC